SVRELSERVHRQRSDHEQVGASQVYIEVVRRRPPRQGEEGLGPNESLSPRRNERHDFVATFDEQANQLASFVSGNAASDPHKNTSHAGNSALERSTSPNPEGRRLKAGEAALAAG